MATSADPVPGAAPGAPPIAFAGSQSTSDQYGNGLQSQPSSQWSDIDGPTQGGPPRCPRAYGEAWGTSRRRGHASPWNRQFSIQDRRPSWDRESRGFGDRRAPSNRPPSVPAWDRDPRMGDRRSPWNRPPFMESTTAYTNRDQDSAYLSDWGSRMGQARSQTTAGDDTVQSPGTVLETQDNTSRYVPPHARTEENWGSGWRGRRNGSPWETIGQLRGERPSIQQPPWQRSPAVGRTPISISESDESNNRPSDNIQDRLHVGERGIESGGWRTANNRPLNTNPPSAQANPRPRTTGTTDADPQRRLQGSVINQSPNSMSERPPIVTSHTGTPITSSPSSSPREPSLTQPTGGREIQVCLDVLQAILTATSNQDHQEERAPIDPRIFELLRRLSPQMLPDIPQRSNPSRVVSESPNSGPRRLSEGSRVGNDEDGAPPESVGDDDIPVAAVGSQGAPTRSSVPHHTDSTASTGQDLPRTPGSPTARSTSGSKLRRSVSTLTGCVAEWWGRARRPREPAYISPLEHYIPPRELFPMSSDAISQSLEPRVLAEAQRLEPRVLAEAQSLEPQVLVEEFVPTQAVAPDQEALSHSSELRRLAEEATSILELCTRTDIEQGDEERDQLIRLAIESIMKMRGQDSLDAQGESGNVEHSEPRASIIDDSTRVDAACIVCYGEVADTVLLPCNHLVLCVMCCDTMGIMERGRGGRQAVPCPMCRRVVEDRIKIFRG